MQEVLKLQKQERLAIYRNTAQEMGVSEAVIEKDYWVCLVLEYLFHKSRFNETLTFKGGTSLSKCYGLIERFSEDLDLILDWRLLGYGKDEPWEVRSKTKQDAFNKEANDRASDFLAGEFLPDFVTGMSEIIGEGVKSEVDAYDPQTINFHFPSLCSSDSILRTIRLEIGALAAWTPSVERTVTPYIFEYHPSDTHKMSTTVITSSAERSFWEKATILHHEANRPEHLSMPDRYSRHYYDLYCIAQSEHKSTALNSPDLLKKVVDFKMRFYPRSWAKYEDAKPGTLRLVPPDIRVKALSIDHDIMAEMLFGEVMPFYKIIEYITTLEGEINSR